MSMILRETRCSSRGLAMGGGLAWFSRLIDSRLYGVAPGIAHAGIGDRIAAVGSAGRAYLPARRASSGSMAAYARVSVVI